MPSAFPDAMITDGAFPAAELLLSPANTDVLTAAVAEHGGVVRQATPTFVDYHPGRNIYVSFDAYVDWPDQAGPEIIAAVARADADDIRGVALVEAAGTTIGVWKVPDDPYVPGMRLVNDAGWVRELVEELGLGGGRLFTELLSYAPRNRAVVRVARQPVGGKLTFVPGQGFQEPEAEVVLYLKAMRRSRYPGLRAAHEVLEGVIPVPARLAEFEDEAIMAFQPILGVPLFDSVAEPYDVPVPDGDELLALLDRFRDVSLDQPARVSTTLAMHLNTQQMAAVMPSLADRLARFRERMGEDRPQEEITIHGDFHEVQLLIDERGIAGILDLDDAGKGHRVDDLAMMLGRLWSYSQTEPAGRERLEAYTWSLLRAWEQHVDPLELRRRMAGVAMNHAAQPFRFQFSGWRAETAAAVDRADWLLRELMSPARLGYA